MLCKKAVTVRGTSRGDTLGVPKMPVALVLLEDLLDKGIQVQDGIHGVNDPWHNCTIGGDECTLRFPMRARVIEIEEHVKGRPTIVKYDLLHKV